MSNPTASPVLLVDDNLEFCGLLGTLLAEQGYLPILAHTAADAATLYGRYRPTALILDLLLPDQTGQRLLDRLKKSGPLPPVFVITGVFKGQAQQEKVRASYPISGWYEKPFDTRNLVEAIVKTTGHAPVARVSHQKVGQIGQDFSIDILDAVEVPGVVARSSDDIEVSIDLSLIDESGPIEADELMTPGPEGLTPTPTPAEVAAELRSHLREGTLEATTVPRLLNAFWLAQETGEIAFARADQTKVVYFDKGRPVYAISNQDTDRLGAIARRSVGLKPADIDRALVIAKDADRPLGEVLVDLGLIDPSKRPELLREQTKMILRSLFSWTTGRYVIGFKTQPPHDRADLKEDVATLVVDGVRDLFELDRLQKLVPDQTRLVPSPSSLFQLHDLPLHDAEASLLLRVTGRESVGALLAATKGPLTERNARAILYALTCIGVLLPAA